MCKGRHGRGEENSHCLIVSLSFLDDGTMGRWDYATSRPTERKTFLIVPFSHFPIVFFLDNGTLRRWDYATSRPPIKLCAKRTTLFTFHFSPFSLLSSPNAPFAEGSPSERSFVRSPTHSKFNNLLCCVESQYVAVGYDATIAYRTTYTHARSIQRYRHVVHHALHEHLTLHSTAIHIV